MKSISLAALLFTITVVVSGCGGASSAKIGGTVTGLASGNSVGLTNNGTDTLTYIFSSASNSFTFNQSVGAGDAYNVTVTTQPTGQVCSVANGSGTVSSPATDITNVSVTCTVGTGTNVALTASIAGLPAGTQLVLTDFYAAGTLTVTGTTASAGGTVSQNFPTSLAPGSIYNVSITAQPGGGHSCTILNSSGAGTVPVSGNPSPVAVSCT